MLNRKHVAMHKTIWRKIRPFVVSKGFDIVRVPSFAKHMRRLGVTLVFDVGANEGQFAKRLRRDGYAGKIVSFEPIAESFARLQSAAHIDPNWTAINLALGDMPGEIDLRVAKSTVCSSIRAANEKIIGQYPDDFGMRSIEKVKIATLDDLMDKFVKPDDVILLKIDVQGYEDAVLAGANKALDRIAALQLELSLSPLYQGEHLMAEQIQFLAAKGFALIDLANVFHDPSGRLLQVDGFFARDR